MFNINYIYIQFRCSENVKYYRSHFVLITKINRRQSTESGSSQFSIICKINIGSILINWLCAGFVIKKKRKTFEGKKKSNTYTNISFSTESDKFEMNMRLN